MIKIEKFNFGDLHKKYHFEDDDSNGIFTLWHYTSVDGFMGIIRDKSDEHKKLHFWFTRSDCLNDTSEGNHVLSMFQASCKEMLAQNKINKAFYDCIINSEISAHQFVHFPITPKDDCVSNSIMDCVPCDTYICSFSLKEDSLDMWRYYSKNNGGYGLKFLYNIFDGQKRYSYSDFNQNAKFCCIHSYRVIYDDAEKKEILENIISDTYMAYINSKDDDDKRVDNSQKFINYALKSFQFKFKHECYKSEQEYRFVLFQPYDKPKHLENELYEVKFRSQNGIVVPYIEVTVESQYASLCEVLISPYIKNESSLATTSDYISKCGFNCTVKKSLLPARE